MDPGGQAELPDQVPVENRDQSLAEIARRARAGTGTWRPRASSCPAPRKMGVRVSLIRRFLTDAPGLHQHRQEVHRDRRFLRAPATGSSTHSAATASSAARAPGCSSPHADRQQVARRRPDSSASIKVPKTWYITSDVLLEFHELQQPARTVVEQKYKDIDQIAARVSAHRPGLQELAASRPRSSRGCRWRWTISSESPADRPQLEPARGPHRVRPSPGSTRACSSPTRAPSKSGCWR